MMMLSYGFRNFYGVFTLLGLMLTVSLNAETLPQAWETALAVNYNIKAAKESICAAREQLKAAQAIRLPGVTLQSGYTARDHESQLSGELMGLTFALPIENKSSFSYQATATIPLYTNGRITSGINAGIAMFSASQADEASVSQTIKMEVANAYVSVLRTRRALEVANSHTISLEGHERDVLNLLNKGMVARNDLLASQVALADARQQLIQVQNRCDLAQAAFNRLLHRPLEQKTQLKDLFLENTSETLDILTRKALSQRSELMAVTKKAQALRHQAAAVGAEDKPQISLAGGYGFEQNDYFVDEQQWSLTIGVKWNLFDGGVSDHRSKVISRKANALEYQHRDLVTIISLQVRQAWLDTQETQKRLKVTMKAIAQAEEHLKVSRNRYNSGLATNTEVLDAETLRIESQYNHANAQYDKLLSILYLKRTIGEL